jgi:hypothetical protein
MKEPNTGIIENPGLAPASNNSFKKRYQSPCIREYGTVHKMTESVSSWGRWDGGHHWKNRTH